VSGRSGEAVLVERGPDLLRRSIEVAGELHLLVSDRRDSLERALDALLHRGANGVELQADAIEAPRPSGGTSGGEDAGAGQADGAHRCHELPTIHHRRALHVAVGQFPATPSPGPAEEKVVAEADPASQTRIRSA
jgi:hypothetical protein